MREHNDSDLFVRLLVIAREIAIRRPENFATLLAAMSNTTPGKADQREFLDQMMQLFWFVYNSRVMHPTMAAANRPCARELSTLVQCVVHVLHWCGTQNNQLLQDIGAHYVTLLLANVRVYFGNSCRKDSYFFKSNFSQELFAVPRNERCIHYSARNRVNPRNAEVTI